jgi:hypothetical protein
MSKLKSLLPETLITKLTKINEGIIDDIMSLVLSPKLKKAAKAIKEDPEYQELSRQAKLAKEELEAIAKRIERNLEKKEKIIQDMKKSGIKVDSNMSSSQVYKAYKDWEKNLDKFTKSKPSNSDLKKYFGS